MNIIPARPGTVARYRLNPSDPSDRSTYSAPVEAWDEEGFALVADQSLGRLVRAKSWDTDFAGLDEEPAIVSVAPAAGWCVRYVLKDGRTWSQPLVGWGIRSDGSVQAITAEMSGYADELECTDQCRVYHPDQDPDIKDAS